MLTMIVPMLFFKACRKSARKERSRQKIELWFLRKRGRSPFLLRLLAKARVNPVHAQNDDDSYDNEFAHKHTQI
jgi:hypothetical protein